MYVYVPFLTVGKPTGHGMVKVVVGGDYFEVKILRTKIKVKLFWSR